MERSTNSRASRAAASPEPVNDTVSGQSRAEEEEHRGTSLRRVRGQQEDNH